MILWLKILNKNIDTITGTPREFPFDENCLYTNNYNETLDSFKGRISHTSEIDIEPYDECEVNFKELDGTIRKTLYFCVDTYTLTQDTIGIDNEKFSYDIELFSQTKLLEGIVCPNLSITPYKLETNKPRKSIYWYLDKYLDLYGRKVRYYDESDQSYYWGNKWYFSQNVISKFSSVDAPELQWNAPTLREVFNDLFMVKDCIPVLRNNEIDLIDLTQKKNPITDYNFLTRSQSADNYVSEIKMNLQNVMQTQLKDIKNTCITNEYLSYTSDDFLITSDNVELKTTYPILNIKHLWMGLLSGRSGSYVDFEGKITFFDLCNLNGKNIVKEYQEYITMPIAFRSDDVLGDKLDYQNYCIYYTRGQNSIKGFTDMTKKNIFLSLQTHQLIREILKSLDSSITNNTTNGYFSTFFKIEYETMTDQVFTASKDKVKNKRTIVDNQTNSWVDAYSQGFLEYMKANRLGNQITMYNQRTSNVWNTSNFGLIDIGDYKDDNVVYQVQYQIFQDHIECNAYATKNYILRNYWVGVNSKIRTWVNAKDEALIRHELEKYYCNVDFTTHSEIELQHGKIGRLCAKSLGNQTISDYPLQFSMIRTYTSGGYMPFYNLDDTTIVFDSDPVYACNSSNDLINLGFTSNGESFMGIQFGNEDLIYFLTASQLDPILVFNRNNGGWVNDAYRTLQVNSVGVNRINLMQYIKSFATISGGRTYYYANELISRVMGNSIVLTMGFDDNVSYKKGRINTVIGDLEKIDNSNNTAHLKSSSLIGVSGGYGIQTQTYKYTDDYAEFMSCNVKLFTHIYNDGLGYRPREEYEQMMVDIIKAPVVDYQYSDLRPADNSIYYDFSKYYYKDNKEIFKLSIQFEYYSENENIFLGDKLAYNNSFVRDRVLSSQPRYLRYFLGNNTEIHTNTIPSGVDEIYNDYQLGDIQMETRLTDVNDNITRVGVLDSGRNFEGYNTLYITNQEGEVLIALRYTPSQVQTGELFIYFNVVRDRDLSVYDENNNIIEEI